MKRPAINILVLQSDRMSRCTGAGIIKALTLSKLHFTLFTAAPSPYVAFLYGIANHSVSPDTKSPQYLAWLIDYCNRNKIDVIFPDGADFVTIVRKRKEIHEQTRARVVAHPDAVIAVAENKLATSDWLTDQGFPHPSYAPVSDRAAVSALVDCAGFPLVAKPYVGECSDGVVLISDEDALAGIRQDSDTLLQKHVGTEKTEYTVSCVLDRDGEIQGTLVLRRRLWHGVTVSCEVDRNEAILAASEAIATRLGARGSLNIQLRIHDGMALCLEINARFSGTTGIRAHMGFNDVEYVLSHYFLSEAPPTLPLVREGIALRNFDEVYPVRLATGN